MEQQVCVGQTAECRHSVSQCERPNQQAAQTNRLHSLENQAAYRQF